MTEIPQVDQTQVEPHLLTDNLPKFITDKNELQGSKVKTAYF